MITLPDPTAWELIHNFAEAMRRWAEAGFATVSQDQFDLRRITCDSCEHWSGATCRRCGCTRLKLWLATEKCPADKWDE